MKSQVKTIRRLYPISEKWKLDPDSAKKELLSKPEVYALLDDSTKKEMNDDGVFEFTNEILDTTQENVKIKITFCRRPPIDDFPPKVQKLALSP